jgi:hypothetical protein
LREHQAKPHILQKSPSLFDRPDGLAIETPLFAPELLEFGVSHKKLSALSHQLSAKTGRSC